MSSRRSIELTVNGESYSLSVNVTRSLLNTLRDEVALTGTKECCEVGECGACTVIINGRPVNSCLMLAVEADGAEIVTVEGLATATGLSALQDSFLETSAVQCGFCIPGQLMSATALLATNPSPTEDEIQVALSGNLCRCAGYEQITKAVLALAKAAR